MLEIISLHPPLSAFPWALIITALIFESVAIFLKKYKSFLEYASVLVLTIGVIGGVLAFLSGLSASKNLPESISGFIDTHFFWGRLTLFVLVPTLLIGGVRCVAESDRKQFLSLIFIVSLLSSSVLLAITGFHGGKLNEARIRIKSSDTSKEFH